MTLTLIFIAYIILSTADFYTSMIGLRGGLAEGNPVAKWFIERLGIVKGLLVLKAIGIAAIGACVYWYPSVWYIPLIAALATAVIVFNNIKLIQDNK